MSQDSDGIIVHLILCYTEDSSGGVALLEAQKRHLEGQPINSDILVDFRVISLNGHHGYKDKLFEHIQADVISQKNSAKLRYVCRVETEVWVNVDTDKMATYNTTPEQVADMASAYGYFLAVNRENLEGDIVRVLLPIDRLSISHTTYIDEINRAIDKINTTKGNAINEAMKLPKYSKRSEAATIFFERLLVLHPELLEQYITDNAAKDDFPVRTLADILKRVSEIYP